MAYNVNKMDNAKLQKIGREAFKMLENEYPAAAGMRRVKQKTNKASSRTPAVHSTVANCIYQYQPPQTQVYHVMNPVSSTEEMISSYEAMKLHDGGLVMDNSRRKYAAVAY